MSYTPSAVDDTQPTSDKPAGSAAAEFRTLKAHVKTQFTSIATSLAALAGTDASINTQLTAINAAIAAINSQLDDTVLLSVNVTAVGAFTWNKPTEGYDPSDIVLVRVWAAGGSGAVGFNGSNVAAASGGEGGAYIEFAIRYEDCPASITGTIGAGGAAVSRTSNGATAGNVGGDTTVTIGAVTLAAIGGAGGIAIGGSAGLLETTPRSDMSCMAILLGKPEWKGQNGGDANAVNSSTLIVGDPGAAAIYGGAGGAGAARYGAHIKTGIAGGVSLYAGDGGSSLCVDATPASAGNGEQPAGGGGAAVGVTGGVAATSGKGGDGQVTIHIVRANISTPLAQLI